MTLGLGAIALFGLLVNVFPSDYSATASIEAYPRAHFLDFIEYTFTLNSSEIFPNETLKNAILDNHTRSEYNISSIEHELMGHYINATDVRVNVTPTVIDESRTRLDLEIYAERVNVTGSSDRFYDKVDLESLYGIHDKRNEVIEIHVPMNVAFSYLGRLS